MCEDNIPGIQASNVCCPTSCGSCGGGGCGRRDGGPNFSGAEACCGGGVRSLDRDCSVTGAAPCVFPEGASRKKRCCTYSEVSSCTCYVWHVATILRTDFALMQHRHRVSIPVHGVLLRITRPRHEAMYTRQRVGDKYSSAHAKWKRLPRLLHEYRLPLERLNSSSSDVRGWHSWHSSQQRLLLGQLWLLWW